MTRVGDHGRAAMAAEARSLLAEDFPHDQVSQGVVDDFVRNASYGCADCARINTRQSREA